MNENIYKMVELVGSSKTSIEDAVGNALSKGSKFFREARWFKITEIRGYIENDAAAYWQVGLKVGFNVEEKEEEEGGFEKPSAEKKAAVKTKAAAKYRCKVCGYIYDPEKGDPDNGINSGIAFENLPDDWICPECGVGKEQFEKI